jgi:hypothetical protein
VFVATALGPGDARAQFDLSVTPTRVTLPVGRTTPTYTVNWKLSWEVSSADPPLTSEAGIWRAVPGGQILGTTRLPLTDPGVPPHLVLSDTFFTERVRVPPEVLAQALELGATGLLYERRFKDSAPIPPDATLPAGVVFALSGALAGPFHELRFDDGSPLRTVVLGGLLRAEAVVSYSGTGDLRAVWEVADAGSTSGEPIFRPLRNVVRHVSASGRVTLLSPELPTSGSGLHLLRLRVVEPETAFPLPVIRYSVLEEGVPEPSRLPTLRLHTPADAATLGPDMRFAWSAVEGASAYQLEIYAEADPEGVTQPDQILQPPAPQVALAGEALAGRLVTGVALPADAREATLSPVQRARLEPGRRYRWRVRAVNADGGLLGESAVREFRLPPAP